MALGTFFGCLGAGKDALGRNSPPDVAQNFMIGLVSGCIATVANNPLDVVKTRIQSGARSTAVQMVPAMLELVKAEGAGALWRGLAARLYRSAPGHGLLFMSYEYFERYFSNK